MSLQLAIADTICLLGVEGTLEYYTTKSVDDDTLHAACCVSWAKRSTTLEYTFAQTPNLSLYVEPHYITALDLDVRQYVVLSLITFHDFTFSRRVV
jgi:hypothetical protein